MTKKWSSRLTFFAFVVLMVGLGSNDSLRGIFSTIFQEHFSLTTTQLGLIVTASYIGNLVFLLVGGNLSTRFSKKRVLQSPENYFEDKRLALDHAQQRLASLAQKCVADRQRQFVQLAARLDAMSPLKVLARGYSVARTEDGSILRDARQVQPGQEIELQLSRGRVAAQVTHTEEETDE